MTERADRSIRRTTIGSVTILAMIAGTVSYLHMHALVALHGQPGWVAALTPLSVDGMIVAASTTLLAESRSGSRGGTLPWGLLVIGSVASLAANVAVAEPSAVERVIAAWPSFALIGSYELLMRQVRRTASRSTRHAARTSSANSAHAARSGECPGEAKSARWADRRRRCPAACLAMGSRQPDGGEGAAERQAIAVRYGRHERWGRPVKSGGAAGDFADAASGQDDLESIWLSPLRRVVVGASYGADGCLRATRPRGRP